MCLIDGRRRSLARHLPDLIASRVRVLRNDRASVSISATSAKKARCQNDIGCSTTSSKSFWSSTISVRDAAASFPPSVGVKI